MPEGIFSSFKVSAMGLKAQRLRLDVAAENLANAETTRTKEGGPYRRKFLVTAEAPVSVFPKYIENEIQLQRTSGEHFKDEPVRGDKPVPSGTEVVEMAIDQTPPRLVYDPSHPDADAKGYVAMPNVNVVEEMVNMISASRAYQGNVEVMNTARTLMLKTLALGQQ